VTTESGSSEALRDTLRGSTDPRVSRTRAALVAAVQSLSEAEAEVSVSAIVREAGISRASFYAHFSGLDELATSLHREAFTAIADLFRLDEPGGPDALRRSQERLVAHFAENRALYAAVAALPTSKESHLAGVRAMAAIIEQTLDAHPAVPAGLQPAATARYISGAAYGLLDAWVAGEVDLDDEMLADHLVRLLPPWFSADR
jgi:AcrR family transcriptional regulator